MFSVATAAGISSCDGFHLGGAVEDRLDTVVQEYEHKAQ